MCSGTWQCPHCRRPTANNNCVNRAGPPRKEYIQARIQRLENELQESYKELSELEKEK